MKVSSQCWKNFKGFIEDYFNDELSEGVDYKVTSEGEVFLINRSSENYEVLFDCAEDSWMAALDLQGI